MMGAVNFSGMDTLLTVQSSTVTKHAITNEPEETWSNLKTIKAKELGPASKEGYEANQQVALSTVKWMIRRDTSLTEKMRVIRSSAYYYISGIQDFGRQGYMILTAENRDNV